MNAPFLTPVRPGASAAIAALALAVAAHARSLGLTVVSIRASRFSHSPSRHLTLRDQRRREWQLRISDKAAPRHTGYDRPHCDIVTVDGVVGSEQAFGFVNRIARGDEAWTAPERTRKRKGQRCRGQR